MNQCASIAGLILYIVGYRLAGAVGPELELQFRCRAIDDSDARKQVQDAFPDCEIITSGVLDDRYAESIVGPNIAYYDGVEVHGVRDLNGHNDPSGTQCEVDDENPEFHSVYLHVKQGGIESVGDFGTLELAQAYANELELKYGFK